MSEATITAIGEADGAVVLWCSTPDDPKAPAFMVAGAVTEGVRGLMREFLRRGYEAIMPGESARIASEEALRLMEADAYQTTQDGTSFTVLLHTKPMHDLAWMKAGIPPAMGDEIARARDAEEREGT